MIILLVILQMAQVSATEVVERSIAHHDPGGVWEELDHTFRIRETRPDGTARHLHVTLDHPDDRFVYEARIGDDEVLKRLQDGECHAEINGSTDISPELAETHRTSCDQIRRYRNYYEYLIGLPMKLRDPGTIISPEVESTIFDQKRALKVRVTYDEEVGSDVWYFYFDPKTFALVGARFHHDESANDGEVIFFEDEVTVGGMTLPQHRRWYRNRDEHYLGMDSILTE